MKIKFENAEGLKDGIYEVKITKVKRAKTKEKKTPYTSVMFVGKGIQMEGKFFDSYFGGQDFQKLVRAVGFEDFDVVTDEIDSEDLEGERIRIEVGPQENNPKFKEIKDYLPLGEDDEDEDDDVEEDDEEEDEDDE